jgi:hypothetical protein
MKSLTQSEFIAQISMGKISPSESLTITTQGVPAQVLLPYEKYLELKGEPADLVLALAMSEQDDDSFQAENLELKTRPPRFDA